MGVGHHMCSYFLLDATFRFNQAGSIMVTEADRPLNEISVELVTSGTLEIDVTVRVVIDPGSAGIYSNIIIIIVKVR